LCVSFDSLRLGEGPIGERDAMSRFDWTVACGTKRHCHPSAWVALFLYVGLV
jgi:hypothetical protein